MQTILSFVLVFIFFSLSLLHVRWAIFGIGDVTKVVPQFPERPSHPPVYMTLIVAFALFAMAVFYIERASMFSIQLPAFISNYAGWAISILFLLRGIGEFNYVGIFSKKRNNNFDTLDRKYYSPLCLFVAVVGIIIEMI